MGNERSSFNTESPMQDLPEVRSGDDGSGAGRSAEKGAAPDVREGRGAAACVQDSLRM